MPELESPKLESQMESEDHRNVRGRGRSLILGVLGVVVVFGAWFVGGMLMDDLRPDAPTTSEERPAAPSAPLGGADSQLPQSLDSIRLRRGDPRREVYSMARGATQEIDACDAVVSFVGTDAEGNGVIDFSTEGATRRFALPRGRGNAMGYCAFEVFDVALDGSRASVMVAKIDQHFP